jgi:murein DD-endopeptidase MepM/ murein hydrolase activator NlpD
MIRSNLLITIFQIFVIFGCASSASIIPQGPIVPKIDENYFFYHKVAEKETLYRISKNFGVDIEDITKINSIEDPSKIEKGQILIVPKVKNSALEQSDNEDFVWPINDATNVIKTNKGIDIKAPVNYNITAVKGGIISFYNENFKNYGKTLVIKHSNNYSSVYCGFGESIVKLGDTVTQGQVIAKNSGLLHFEIRKGYKSQNPYYYLPK